jgi:taurine dioxygenase
MATELATRSPLPKLNHVSLRPISGTIGAEIFGIDLSRDLTDDERKFLYWSAVDNLALFFPNQPKLTPAQLRRFSELFGEIDKAPFVYPFVMPSEEGFPEIFNIVKNQADRSVNLGGFWHADVTYRERPHKFGIMYAKECPTHGGDTMFANQYLAYETLSEGMRDLLSGLKAVHSSAMEYGGETARFGAVSKTHATSPEDRKFSSKPADIGRVEIIENTHPVIRANPDTGRKCLYVNRGFTSRFEGMTTDESRPLLEYLWTHASRPEFTCRYRWTPNAVGIWDNRSTLHFALNDYFGQKRHMQRIAIHEEARPI